MTDWKGATPEEIKASVEQIIAVIKKTDRPGDVIGVLCRELPHAGPKVRLPER
jgi:hypothetical protein